MSIMKTVDMTMIDARVPVLLEGFGLDAVPAGAVVAWLVADGVVAPPGPAEALAAATAHAPGCACCRPRGAAADALRRLFLRRARGEVAFFDHVAVLGGEAARAAVAEALDSDLFVAARFRVAPG